MTRRGRTLALLAAGRCLAAEATVAPAQQRTPAAPAQPSGRIYYDQYEPSRTPQLSRQPCLRDEEAVGGYCVKKCKQGYRLVPDSNPQRCRSIEPLPPGQLPGPIRRETGQQPKLPPPPPGTKPAPPPKGA